MVSTTCSSGPIFPSILFKQIMCDGFKGVCDGLRVCCDRQIERLKRTNTTKVQRLELNYYLKM